VAVWHGKQEIQLFAPVYPDRDSQVLLPRRSLVQWAPCKACWMWTGAVTKYLFRPRRQHRDASARNLGKSLSDFW
jgi:hypothetical protein